MGGFCVAVVLSAVQRECCAWPRPSCPAQKESVLHELACLKWNEAECREQTETSVLKAGFAKEKGEFRNEQRVTSTDGLSKILGCLSLRM